MTYQGERLKENVESLTNEAMPGSLLLSCDVTKQDEVDETFRKVGEEFGRLDFLIHSIAFAPAEELKGRKQFGIYKLEKGKLTLCLTGSPEATVKDRPKEFAVKDKAGILLELECPKKK